jgi:anthranilate phosphoribosyltransferase
MSGTFQQQNSISAQDEPVVVDIRPLLQRLWPDPGASQVTAKEIADAIGLIFTNQLSPVQTGSLLTALHFTGWDRRADVLAEASAAMRAASAPIDFKVLNEVVQRKARKEGRYYGGLVSEILIDTNLQGVH